MYKNTIEYIEFWATRHCNLNCCGCSAAAPIKSPWFIDLNSLKKDLKRLKYLKINIKNICVLGGEPLLHPKLTKIFSIIKSIYPYCNLSIITNGLLLLNMNDIFWYCCQKYKVKLNVTCFPILLEEKIQAIEEIIKKYKLQYHLTNKKKFNKILVLNNTAKFEDIVNNCKCNNAYNLYQGNISRCIIPMVASDFNKYFHVNFLTDGKLNIYKVKNAEEILNFLNTPNKSCMNCSVITQKVEWKKLDKKPTLNDWLIL